MNIYEKLLQVQTKLKAPKNQKNNFGGYMYRSCEDILEAVKPLCNEAKAVTYFSDTIETVNNEKVLVANLTFADTESETKILVQGRARIPESKKGMDESQVTGCASSYARKYALNGLFAIDDTKDADTMDNRTSTSSNSSSYAQNAKSFTSAKSPKIAKPAIVKGEATPKEQKELNELCRLRFEDGCQVFSKEEMQSFVNMRQEHTASEVIAYIKSLLDSKQINAHKKILK